MNEPFGRDVLEVIAHGGIVDRGDALLQDLLGRLRNWFPTIKRAIGATELTVTAVENNGFLLTAVWKGGEHIKHFSKQYVFGGSFHLTEPAWRVESKVCDYARGFMREVLAARGAL